MRVEMTDLVVFLHFRRIFLVFKLIALNRKTKSFKILYIIKNHIHKRNKLTHFFHRV